MDAQGKEVPGARGYKYFGRAKELPGVKELFQPKAPTLKEKSRAELLRNVDADYYGYRDEEDGTLLEYEQEQEELGKDRNATRNTPVIWTSLGLYLANVFFN